jgi:hypothetical protein
MIGESLRWYNSWNTIAEFLSHRSLYIVWIGLFLKTYTNWKLHAASSSDIDMLQNYTKKMIYCGTKNNVFLHVYITTIIHIQVQNKMVEFLVAWLFTMPYVWKMFLSIMINHCWRELWPITIERDYWSWCSLWWCIFNIHYCRSSFSNTFFETFLGLHMSSYNYKV